MAIAQTLANIVIGTATTLAYGGADLGPTTEDGINIVVTPEYFDHKNDQIKGMIKKSLTDRAVTIQFALTEADIANYHIALNLSTASLVAGVTLNIDDTQQADAVLSIVSPTPLGGARTWTFHVCQIMSAVEHQITKSGQVVLNVEIQAMYDIAVNNEFGQVVDTAP